MAIGVPGEVRAYEIAYREFGRGVPWAELFKPTIQLCEEGYIISAALGAAIKGSAHFIRADPTLRFDLHSPVSEQNESFSLFRALFVKNATTNELYTTGDRLRRPQLAQTLRIIAEQGADAFYTGELADKIVKEVQDRGGIITRQDLADFDVDFREALSVNINDTYTAYTTHAPSSGPILTFILNILQGISTSSSSF